jgi:hypothetical protein
MHTALEEDLQGNLADHQPKLCIICNPEQASSHSDTEYADNFTAGKIVSYGTNVTRNFYK